MAQQSYKIFIDTSFFIAFIDRSDLNFAKCVPIMDFLGSNNYQVYTSSLIILQTFNRLQNDMGSIGVEFLQVILESNINVLYPGQQEIISAFRFLKINRQNPNSLTELISAILMEKNGISACLTYDYWHNLMGTQKSQLITQ